MRFVNTAALSRLLLPTRVRHRAISIDVSTPRSAYALDEPIPFTVTMRNALPVPITIRTRSPLLWTWTVDGLEEASRVSVRDPPSEPRKFRFDRGERKRFSKRWHQSIRVSDSEWEPVEPGEYAIGAALTVTDPEAAGLADETTVRIRPE